MPAVGPRNDSKRADRRIVACRCSVNLAPLTAQ
jgi:hypothetical protein